MGPGWDTHCTLPYIGQHPDLPHAWFALAYGGNGTTFGMMATNMLRDAVLGRPHEEVHLFRSIDLRPGSSRRWRGGWCHANYYRGGGMEARAKFLGHSIHQMLIVFPLGLLATAVIFDIIGFIISGTQWVEISFWLITLGIISGLVAAVFGLADWTIIPAGTRAKRVGTLHGLGNVVVVGLFAVSWILRLLQPGHQPGVVAFICSFAGAGLALITGWLGGELVARLGVGVSDGANENAPSSLSGRPAHGGAPGD
jgi:uncharacterized membrane protein